ncbi:hypothetical protein F511_19405 [Dorcoceras hygrometricum]|uniref:Uncharacterized protein n=1 Tax=Dorcoceras hygrometricum TaxID=472368 RepID=A0A2Z7CYL2_9LAMI|nr:hypothetical protein F511_19405 [Dorcoceras hygrometricum]
MTSAVMSSFRGSYSDQQVDSADEEKRKRKRRRARNSADGLALMTSSVTSSYSADGLRDQLQESAVSHTVAAVVHLRSLGVLTAAGCGIGSVHEVVRSNLLVEPSEVEEGEIGSYSDQQVDSADEEKRKRKRRRARNSADGLALMTSSVTSSYSADGLRDQLQESAGSLHPDARGSDVV